MKTFAVVILLILPLMSFSQQATPKSAFLEKWENSKTYLIEIAEVMPESLYNYKPSERQMSFKEQLLHIEANMDWLGTTYFSKDKRNDGGIPKSKADVIALVSNGFDRVSTYVEHTSEETLTDTIKFFAGPKSKLQILNLLQDHVTHHRGQLVVYLNLKAIEPPTYVGW